MNENDAHSGSPGGWQNSAVENASDHGHGAKRSVGKMLTEVSTTALDEARTLGGEAQQLAEDQADKVKDTAASHMDAFADALRAASDHLSQNQSGPASEMVAHAASGLESLSRSLHGKSTGEMIDTVRQFGRANPIGFLAGSVLAGVALGRFAAAGTQTATAPDNGATPPGASLEPQAQSHADRGLTQ